MSGTASGAWLGAGEQRTGEGDRSTVLLCCHVSWLPTTDLRPGPGCPDAPGSEAAREAPKGTTSAGVELAPWQQHLLSAEVWLSPQGDVPTFLLGA